MVSKAEKRARAQAKLEAKTAAPSTQTTESASAAKPTVVTKVVGVLKVKDGQSFRGARQAWYDVLKAHDGKPAQDFLESTAKTPPSLPKSGRAENPSGWLRYYVRTGVVTIEQPKA
jgi:hypothetical protein